MSSNPAIHPEFSRDPSVVPQFEIGGEWRRIANLRSWITTVRVGFWAMVRDRQRFVNPKPPTYASELHLDSVSIRCGNTKLIQIVEGQRCDEPSSTHGL